LPRRGTVTQPQIDAYADAWRPQPDPDPAAATTPFGGTIAHGMLELARSAK
jgi:acyl dehydratase